MLHCNPPPLFSLSLFFSLSLSIYLSIYMSVSPSQRDWFPQLCHCTCTDGCVIWQWGRNISIWSASTQYHHSECVRPQAMDTITPIIHHTVALSCALSLSLSMLVYVPERYTKLKSLSLALSLFLSLSLSLPPTTYTDCYARMLVGIVLGYCKTNDMQIYIQYLRWGHPWYSRSALDC